MADDQDSGDKSFEASQKKLDDARKKGDLAKSTDLNATFMYLGYILVGLTLGAPGLLAIGEAMSAMLGRADALSRLVFDGRGAPVLRPAVLEFLRAFAPFVIVPAVMVMLSIVAQRAFVIAPTKIKPKLSRISFIQNAKNKFGANGLFEFVKSTVKMVLFAWILFAYLQFRFNDIIATIIVTPEGAIVKMLRYAMEFLALVFVVSLVVGAIDYGWQRFEHLRKQRMSHKEVRDEHKNMEGDPHLKQARRSRAEEIAMNAMLADVPKADVVVVNPTHYAVALKWSRASGSAPECVAKGVDEIALRIRELAGAHNVPIHSDPPTARALFASIEIGQEISPDHYKAVAAAIRFSDAMRAKAKGRVT